MNSTHPTSGSFSRRDFLRGGALGALAAGAAPFVTSKAEAGHEGLYPSAVPAPTGFDFTKSSGALQADKIVDSACQFCNSNCRLKVHIKDGRIIDVLGEPADSVQAGGLCVKAEMMTQLVYNRFRLTKPLKRVAGRKGATDSKFEECSWEEALDIIAQKFIALRDDGEAHTIANKTSGRLQRGTGSVIGRFFTLLGSPNDTDVGPECNDAGGNALGATFGMGNFTNGYGFGASHSSACAPVGVSRGSMTTSFALCRWLAVSRWMASTCAAMTAASAGSMRRCRGWGRRRRTSRSGSTSRRLWRATIKRILPSIGLAICAPSGRTMASCGRSSSPAPRASAGCRKHVWKSVQSLCAGRVPTKAARASARSTWTISHGMPRRRNWTQGTKGNDSSRSAARSRFTLRSWTGSWRRRDTRRCRSSIPTRKSPARIRASNTWRNSCRIR